MEWCRDMVYYVATECGLEQKIYVEIELFMLQQGWSRSEEITS